MQKRFGLLKSQREFDSGLEAKVAEDLEGRGYALSKNPVKKTGVHYEYTLPSKKYYPDWVISAGRVIEAKGIFDDEERLKIKTVRAQHPDLEICMVFSNPKAKIRKGSPTTYAAWCDKHGVKWCKGPSVPDEWLQGVPKGEAKGSV